GFTLTHDEPFPPGDEYQARVTLNGVPAATYTFSVVGPAVTMESRLLHATTARGATDDYEPIEPTDSFAPDEEVYLVGSADLAKGSTLEAHWYIGGEEDETGARSLTAEEDYTDAGFYFSFLPEGGWPEGEHQVRLVLDNEEVGRYTFSIVAETAAAPEGVATLTGERSVTINALYFATDFGGKAVGGVAPVQVSVRPASRPGELRVGFFEEEVAGTGSMWRAAGWTAVVVASQLLNIDPRDYEFSFSIGGRIDGPSAGAYLTAATVAALLGDSMREDVAMTGTINPDGTIGPVGGIPHKIEGAAEKGLKLVLIPAGSRFEMDQNTGQMVDLVERGSELGVQVEEVSTIYEAYELLTDGSIPRAEVTARTPQLPPRAFDRTRAKAQEWMARYEEARNRLNAVSPEILPYFDTTEADETADAADKAMQQGLAAVAYQRAFMAAAETEVLLLAAEMVERYATGGVDAALDYVQAARTSVSELDAVTRLLRTESPQSAGDYVALFNAYTSLGQAQGLVLLAETSLEQLQQQADQMAEEDILVALAEIATYYALAGDSIQAARDSVDIGFGYGGTPVTHPERIEAMQELLRRAAEANVAYFESTIVDQYARAFQIHPEQMREQFMSFDTEYLLTVAADQGVALMSEQITDPTQRAALVLGSSIANYAQSAGLVAKYYSLQAELDEEGNIVSIPRERALADMLDLADRRAKELISLNGDDIPIMAVLAYEAARVSRQGSAEDQLMALEQYWTAATLAQAQAYIAGQ
ncbi:MAG: hypothetical protein D6775_09810, partial [Caldilineae bacterium]